MPSYEDLFTHCKGLRNVFELELSNENQFNEFKGALLAVFSDGYENEAVLQDALYEAFLTI